MKSDPIKLIESIVTACFVGTWIALPLGALLLFRLRKEVAFKRKWTPRLAILAGGLFLFFSTTLMVLETRSFMALGILFLTAPAVALITFLNLKLTKFCDKCGATLYNSNWFVPLNFCSKCGAELDPKPVLRDYELE